MRNDGRRKRKRSEGGGKVRGQELVYSYHNDKEIEGTLLNFIFFCPCIPLEKVFPLPSQSKWYMFILQLQL